MAVFMMSSVQRTLAVVWMNSQLLLLVHVNACSCGGGSDNSHRHYRHLFDASNNHDATTTTSSSSDDRNHQKRIWRHHAHFFPNGSFASSGHGRPSSERDIHIRSLYPGPYLHTVPPQDFELCGAPAPSLDDKIELGMAFADYAREFYPLEFSLHSFHQQEINKGGAQRKKEERGEKMVIPVWFHVFQQPNGYGRMKTRQIKEGFMSTVHKAFEGSNITFVLKGVKKHVSATWFDCDDHARAKERTRKGGKETLNVFVCNLASKGYGGYAFLPPIVDYIPELDGVSMANPTLGLAEFIHQALVHEVGHWMGLLHSFEDGCNKNARDHYEDRNYPDYFFVGDGVADTPAHSKPTWDFEPKNNCWRGDNLDTCKNIKGLDPVDNYMNYLPGECFADYGRFTKGQFQRMRAQYRKWRAPPKVVPKVNVTGTADNATANFTT